MNKTEFSSNTVGRTYRNVAFLYKDNEKAKKPLQSLPVISYVPTADKLPKKGILIDVSLLLISSSV